MTAEVARRTFGRPVRTTPPELEVMRARLLRDLALRFERPVTLVRASAGFGKTTLLAQAIEQNRIDPQGIDVYLRCRRQDADAAELARSIQRACGSPELARGRGSDRADLDPAHAAVLDALTGLGPTEVALHLDDVHQLRAGSSGLALLASLLDDLAPNLHVVASGWRIGELRLSRLRAAGAVSEMGEHDLAFDDTEVEALRDRLAALGARGSLDADALGRWPALLVLDSRHGRPATLGFLRDEVLAVLARSHAQGPGDGHLDALATLTLFDRVPERLVAALCTSADVTGECLGELPLCELDERGWSMHPLWREALAPRLDPAARTDALRVGAGVLVESGELMAAFDAALDADDAPAVAAVLRQLIGQPMTSLQLDDLRRVAARLPTELTSSVDAALLDALCSLAGHDQAAATRLEDVAARARLAADAGAESNALWRLLSVRPWFGAESGFAPLLRRARELAAGGDPLAQALELLWSAYEAGTTGSQVQATEHLAQLRRVPPEVAAQTAEMRMGVLVDIGRPEEVPMSVELTREAGRAPMLVNAGVVGAFALWLRGDVPPELAAQMAGPYLTGAAEAAIPHHIIVTHTVLAHIYCAAGRTEEARRLVDTAIAFGGRELSGVIGGYVPISEATIAACRHDEDEAGAQLRRAATIVPLERWPARCYLTSLPMTYLLLPESRAMLDRAVVGPALSRVLQAGRALVDLRERGDAEPAARLPWATPDLLRAHLTPPHLAELAVAAIAAGAAGATQVVEALPARREQLRWVSSRHRDRLGEHASALLVALPARPAYDLRIRTLGAMGLYRDGVAVTSPEWVRRERVRQLLAFLVERRRVTRSDIIGALWPDLEPDRASANLRANLNYLHRALQPDRLEGDPPWFVQLDGDALALASDGLEVDAWDFDRLVVEARAAETERVPGVALERYLTAVELYQGDYLAPWADATWGDFERIRLRSLAAAAACRAGEILLSRGEPEEALRLATRASDIEPMLERSHRLRIRALLGTSDRPAARRAAELLRRLLADARLEAEFDTTQLLRRVLG